ncbi:hypothetical protein OSB04_027273 [Centaurea solstitialis]|uniref:Transcription repressor n=1 Tax=Centaurea solstitialis TaxID=347529 RepID=A0AA38VZK1_9ASTR|nr:hypothetical protein OSB04_027273 [Centaurea solstitialis]
MGKNIMINLIPSLFLPNKLHKQPWSWPSCNHPKTLSFRATTTDSISVDPKEEGAIIPALMHRIQSDPKEEGVIKPALMHRIPSELIKEEEVDLTTLDSCFTNSSESASISTESEKYFDGNECSSSVETIVRGVRSSERLFFRPDRTSSILETQGSSDGKCTDVVEIDDGGGGGGGLPYKESVAMEMESDNPYSDFKKSMKEMVESHGLKDWDCLMELLRWYLRMNGKNNHEFIVGAFVDLLSGISGGGGDGGCGGGGSRGISGSDHSTVSFTSVGSTFLLLYLMRLIRRRSSMEKNW